MYETAAAATLTIGSGITVRRQQRHHRRLLRHDAVVNQGTIDADDSGGLTAPFVYDTDFSGGVDRQHGGQHQHAAA